MKVNKDSEFFYSFIVFQVEDTLFKFTRKPFIEESDVFRDMFNPPTSSDTICDGADEEHPLFLNGIACDDFRAFLKALYAPRHHDPSDLTSKQWLSVLHLAHMWQFIGLRDEAIKRLDSAKLDAIQKIHVARKYEIPDWISRSYAELVQRKNALTDEEAEQLGAEEAFKITRFRAQVLNKILNHYKYGHQSTTYEMTDGCEAFEVPGLFKITTRRCHFT